MIGGEDRRSLRIRRSPRHESQKIRTVDIRFLEENRWRSKSSPQGKSRTRFRRLIVQPRPNAGLIKKALGTGRTAMRLLGATTTIRDHHEAATKHGHGAKHGTRVDLGDNTRLGRGRRPPLSN